MGVPQNHYSLSDFPNFPYIWIAPFLENQIKPPFLTYLWKDPPSSMVKSTMSMAIFNSYAKLPEGSDQYEPLLITISHS